MIIPIKPLIYLRRTCTPGPYKGVCQMFNILEKEGIIEIKEYKVCKRAA